jgi:protein O-mannosyl-transferase
MRWLIVEKAPLFALAVASSVVTFLVQRQGGAVTGLGLLPLDTRLENAVVAYARYVLALVWPADMAIFYPYSESLPTTWVAGSVVGLALASLLALAVLKRRPYVPVGWFWFLGTLVPVIGIVQVGTQAIADRYTYVPYVGLFIVVAWGVGDLVTRPIARRLLAVAAVAVVVAYAIVARAQVDVWRTNWTVWSHALEVTSGNYIAHNELGVMLVEQDKHDEALPHFEAASRVKPEYVEARNNLGLAYSRRGRIADAIAQFALAVQLKPETPETRNHLGFALMSVGRTDDALAQYREAVRLKPDFALARNNLGFLLAAGGNVADAIPQFKEAVRIEPNGELGHLYLAMALGADGKPDEARRHFQEVLRINPANTGARDAIDKIDKLGAPTAKKTPGAGR